jgi:adenine-specific DNA-methyltransferase
MAANALGQIFTPPHIVRRMLALRQNRGATLEPAAGDGAFLRKLNGGAVGIEIDSRHAAASGAMCMDFFDYPIARKFKSVVANPPYVRFQDIPRKTKEKLNLSLFDLRANLYLFFMEKSLRHLDSGGEMIFITPRDFLKATSARKLNRLLYDSGTITHFAELGDARVFKDAAPNCAIWRFVKGDFSRRTDGNRRFMLSPGGQIMFCRQKYEIAFADIFFVKVGAVSGLDKAFVGAAGSRDFVYSQTAAKGKTRRMIYNQKNHPALARYKDALLARKIRPFNQSNWWQWGRTHYESNAPRIYVNAKTRNAKPFFIHPCKNYDGAVLAIFPHNPRADIRRLCEMLNEVNWAELGFVCDGRFLFAQRALEQTLLPRAFLSAAAEEKR